MCMVKGGREIALELLLYKYALLIYKSPFLSFPSDVEKPPSSLPPRAISLATNILLRKGEERARQVAAAVLPVKKRKKLYWWER